MDHRMQNKDDETLQFYKWDEYLKLTPKQRQKLKQLCDAEEKKKAEEAAKASSSTTSSRKELAKDKVIMELKKKIAALKAKE